MNAISIFSNKGAPPLHHLGDITKISGAAIAAVDVITFGSPCQDLSVAGQREGLEGDRSGLFMDAARIIREMRETTHGKQPAFAVWENVPGAFSSRKGEDFRTVLEELARIAEPGISMPRPSKWKTAGAVMGNGWSIAWRVLDAQYWGVPQRRRRIALVMDFGGQSAPEILFEPESLSGDTSQGRAEREGTAGDIEGGACVAGFGETGQGYWQQGVKTIRAQEGGAPANVGLCLAGNMVDRETAMNGSGVQADISYTLNTVDRHAVAFMAGQGAKAGGIAYAKEVAPTLKAAASGLNQASCACYPEAFHTLTSKNARNVESAQTPNVVVVPEIARTLTARYDSSPCVDRGQNIIAVHPAVTGTLCASGAGLNRPAGQGNEPDLCIVQVCEYCQHHAALASGKATTGTIMASCATKQFLGNQEALSGDYHIIETTVAGLDCRNGKENGDICGTLQAKSKGGFSYNCTHPVRIGMIVRRLTPLECERLQGFPDGWTEAGLYMEALKGKQKKLPVQYPAAWEKGMKRLGLTSDGLLEYRLKTASDAARYRALGNSIALPPWRYVMGNIYKRLKVGATLGSLFDGIGGFPLVWRELGGVTLWASEIDAYCAAVTAYRFS